MTDTLTSAFFQRLDEHLSMHRFSEAVAMVQPPEAPTDPSQEFRAVFKTAASNAMIFEEQFETLLPLLNWFAHHGADPFDWPAGLGQSVYEDCLDHAWSHRSASYHFSDSPLLRWCWETPQAPELFEHSVTAQLEVDGTKAWFKSSRGRQLGSLVQLEGAAKNHVDWNRVWADGRSTVLMAVDMALNPMDFKKGEDGKERYDEWVEAFRGLRRIAKEIAPTSREAAALFWLGEAWWLAMTEVADKQPYGQSRAGFWEKGQRAYLAFHKELQRRFPADYRQRFDPEGAWADWLHTQGQAPGGVKWARIAVWGSALRGLENTRVGTPSQWEPSSSAEGLDGPSGAAIRHQLAVLRVAAPLLEKAGWDQGGSIRSSSPSNQIWLPAWTGFVHHMAKLTSQARQEVFSDPAVWWVAAPALTTWNNTGMAPLVLQELLEQAPWPPSPTVRGLLEQATTSSMIANVCRSRDLEHALPAPTAPRNAPRF